MSSFASTLVEGSFSETDPRKLEAATEQVSRKDVREAFLIAEESEEVLVWIDEQAERGADHVVITDVSYEQDVFYETAADEILPQLR